MLSYAHLIRHNIIPRVFIYTIIHTYEFFVMYIERESEMQGVEILQNHERKCKRFYIVVIIIVRADQFMLGYNFAVVI
jgi:hypothetical protein